MPNEPATVIARFKRYDRWFLAVGLALCVAGYFFSRGSVAFWLLILGGACIGASTFLSMAWGVKQDKERQKQ